MMLLDIIYYVFIFVVFIQVFFYLFFFSRFAFIKQKKKSRKNIAISVIICAKNEAKNLKQFLPSIISQDYPDFEIILINDASNDKSLKVMRAFAKNNDKIKIVDVKNIEAFWGNKKYALTLGIKASKHNFLLFTDADCQPLSKSWITEMSRHFDDKTNIVLGYGAYSKIKNSILNKLIRFETLITALQYFSFAKAGIPYMGVGRNLAYKKAEFFNAKGFMGHMNIRSGDDDLFINQVATKHNTAICYTKNSFTISKPEKTFKNWFKQKKRHVSTARHYKFIHKFLLAGLYLSQMLFWLLGVVLLITSYKISFVISLLLVRLIIQYVIVGFSTKKLGEKDVLVLLPFLEICLITFQLVIFIDNLISKSNHWK